MRRTLAVIPALVSCALLLSGCASQTTMDSAPTAPESTRTETTTAEQTPASEESTPTEEQCATPNPDPATNYPEGSQGEVGTFGDPPTFAYTVYENAYDPCAGISWIILRDDTNAQDALLIFDHGYMTANDYPLILPRLQNVERITDDQLNVNFNDFNASLEVHEGVVVATEGNIERFEQMSRDNPRLAL